MKYTKQQQQRDNQMQPRSSDESRRRRSRRNRDIIHAKCHLIKKREVGDKERDKRGQMHKGNNNDNNNNIPISQLQMVS
jgi:hypothetical protein